MHISKYLKAFARDDTSASLGGGFTQAVADLDFKKHKVPHVANALLEAQLLSPKVVDGICRMVAVPKIVRLKAEASRQRVLQAEQMMEDARELGRQTKAQDDARYVHQLEFLDVRIIAVLLGMPKVSEKAEFTTREEASKGWWARLSARALPTSLRCRCTSSGTPVFRWRASTYIYIYMYAYI